MPDWSHVPAEILAAWPNCATSDCEYKACTWAPLPDLCAPCNEVRIGKAAIIAAWNATHDMSWEEAEAIEDEEDLEDVE